MNVMKKIYNSPYAKSIDLSAEGDFLTLSLNGGNEGGPGVSENGDGVQKGDELTRQQSIWDYWKDEEF